MTSDQELLRAWRAGDREAGGTLFERHFAAIRRFFRNKVDHQVEDLVQRTFTACVEARDRFRGDSSFRTYLFAIAHNVLRDHIRRRRRGTEELDLDVRPRPSTSAPRRSRSWPPAPRRRSCCRPCARSPSPRRRCSSCTSGRR
jgi:DNA-directed RNA polymerase specialized sigma24 family protein